jgi:hypothetical protein
MYHEKDLAVCSCREMFVLVFSHNYVLHNLACSGLRYFLHGLQ